MDRTTRRISTVERRPTVTVTSPAKVNLILRILDRRPDGYHNLWSLMQTVGLADSLTLTLDPDSSDICLTCTHPDVPLGSANLIHRAASAVLARAQVRTGVTVHLEKRIPMGAGLGGGSSNAAATVVGLTHLLNLRWSPEEMAETTYLLGSDVPFFFYAPTAAVAGRGERVRAVTLTGSRWILLVNPGFGVETAWAYRTLAASRSQPPTLPPSIRAFESTTALDWETVGSAMSNDFETIVYAEHPTLLALTRRLQEAGAEVAMLSGTGATVFGVFSSAESAMRAQAGFAGEPTMKTWVVQTDAAASGALTVTPVVSDAAPTV